MFRSKTIIPEMFRNASRIILEGAGNVLGPSGIFPERTRAKNTMSQPRGTRSHDSWKVFYGVWGAPWGHPPYMVEHVGEVGPPWGSPHMCITTAKVGGPLGGLPPAFGGISHLWWVDFWKGPPLWAFHPQASHHPFLLHYK